MKDTKMLIISAMTILSNHCYSQVGINTQNPRGVFHVDGARDNAASGAPTSQQQANDFVVTSSGNVGIGTVTPSRKLEVVSSTSPALRIEDGTQQPGYVLMSDVNGNGSWKSLTTAIIGDFPSSGYFGSVATSVADPKYVGISLNLPPGKWLVLTNIQLVATPAPTGGNGAWVRLQWSKTQNTANTSGISGSLNSGVLLSQYGIATGASIINNTDSTNTTYYLNLSGTDLYGNYNGNWFGLGANSWKGNSIIAYPAN